MARKSTLARKAFQKSLVTGNLMESGAIVVHYWPWYSRIVKETSHCQGPCPRLEYCHVCLMLRIRDIQWYCEQVAIWFVASSTTMNWEAPLSHVLIGEAVFLDFLLGLCLISDPRPLSGTVSHNLLGLMGLSISYSRVQEFWEACLQCGRQCNPHLLWR